MSLFKRSPAHRNLAETQYKKQLCNKYRPAHVLISTRNRLLSPHCMGAKSPCRNGKQCQLSQRNTPEGKAHRKKYYHPPMPTLIETESVSHSHNIDEQKTNTMNKNTISEQLDITLKRSPTLQLSPPAYDEEVYAKSIPVFMSISNTSKHDNYNSQYSAMSKSCPVDYTFQSDQYESDWTEDYKPYAEHFIHCTTVNSIRDIFVKNCDMCDYDEGVCINHILDFGKLLDNRCLR